MEAIAKYDFKATADDELSFKRGEVLKDWECSILSSYWCVNARLRLRRPARDALTKSYPTGPHCESDRLGLSLPQNALGPWGRVRPAA
ncbi:hypothetical protein SKAU_G00301100 [Synaphobranchus kaupii]|uniref:SH3 domain-containing protein n=1 Tax=Synaphobranchus kaupii TaxID=118154 RepID=A0A9Q1EVU1_SYNKA|nr:hypothetical protein SKAU_G00301100 [Synaphobranchus kaupii]